MHEREFTEVGMRLLKGGIDANVAERAVAELRDHFDDLCEEAAHKGLAAGVANEWARQRIGDADEFVAAMVARKELKTWAFRHPRVALVVYPVACLVSLPAIPVLRGVEHAPTLARWGASMLGAGVVTVGLLLALRISILFG